MCVHALNKTSLKTNKQKDFFWSFRFIASCLESSCLGLVHSLKSSPSEAAQQSVLPPGYRPLGTPRAQSYSACFRTFTFVSVRWSPAWGTGYSFPSNLSCHPYQTELQSLLGWCTYRIEPWWQISRRRPEAVPQTEHTRPTLKSLSWSRKNTKTVQVTGMHVYIVGSFSLDIQIEGVGNAVVRENR